VAFGLRARLAIGAWDFSRRDGAAAGAAAGTAAGGAAAAGIGVLVAVLGCLLRTTWG
jgi:hypothetical protein